MNIDIDKIKTKLLIKYPYFGSLIANTKIVQNNSIKTARTDGETIEYNSKYLSTLTSNQQLFVLAHEVFHIAYNHINRRENLIPKLWNEACDAVININLEKDGLDKVPNCVYIPWTIDYNALDVYNILLKDKSKKDLEDYLKNSDDVGHDTHSNWEDAKNNNQTEIKEKSISKIEENNLFKNNRNLRKKILKKYRDDLVAKTLNKNEVDQSIRTINNIGSSTNLVDWRKLLQDNVNIDDDWSYKNATIEYGVVTPHLIDKEKSRTEIIVDTSGSVDEDMLKNFLRECKNILNNSQLKVGCFDTRFYGFHDVYTEEDIDNLKIEGFGYTDFSVAVNSFTDDCDNRIIFTDGYDDDPKINKDIIWIVYKNFDFKPKYGRVIYISEKMLNDLNLLSNSDKKTK